MEVSFELVYELFDQLNKHYNRWQNIMAQFNIGQLLLITDTQEADWYTEQIWNA